VTLKSALVAEGNSNLWYHSKAWVQFPICLPYSNYGHIPLTIYENSMTMKTGYVRGCSKAIDNGAIR